MEYKLYYEPTEIKTRLAKDDNNNKDMSNKEFLNFLQRTLDYVSVDLVGMSLIVLKNKYAGTQIKLMENRIGEKHDKIDGTIWMESRKASGLKVYINERGSPSFNIESDIAKSLYKYYFKDDEVFPSLIHV